MILNKTKAELLLEISRDLSERAMKLLQEEEEEVEPTPPTPSLSIVSAESYTTSLGTECIRLLVHLTTYKYLIEGAGPHLSLQSAVGFEVSSDNLSSLERLKGLELRGVISLEKYLGRSYINLKRFLPFEDVQVD